MSKQQINRRPPASPFSLARTEVLKAPVQDLLSPPRSPLLIQHLDTAILSQGQGASPSALADQYSLLAAILKRLAALVRQPDSMAMVWPIVEPFIQDRLALIEGRLWNGVETSLTGASQCVENLVSLSRALSGTTDDASSSPLLSALFQRSLSSTLRTKASVQILTAVLPSLPTGERLERLAPDLLDRLLARSMDRHLVLQQGKLLAAYLARYLEGTTEEDACLLQNNLAQRVVRQLLVVDGDSDDADDGNLSTSRTNLVQQALPPLLPAHSTFLRALLAALDNVDGAVPGREEASLALLALASRAGLCTPVGEPLSDEDERKGLLALPLERLRLALAHPSLSVRLAALTLVAERSGTGVCLVEGEIALVKEFLEGDISVNENEARNPIVIRIQKILLRVRSSSNTVVRSITKVEGFQNLTAEEERSLSGLKERLARSKNFVQWLADFFTAQLRPGATFPRTLLSLRLLRLLTDLGAFIDVTPSPSPSSGATATQSPLTFPFDIRFFTADGSTTQRLLRTLLSTFPELRVFALELLERATPRPPGLETPLQIQALERAALEGPLANPRGSESHAGALAFRLVLGLRFGRVASGGQVDIAGQVQFVEALLDTLDARLALARGQTLLRAAASEPLHGFLQALQEILPLVDLSASSSEGTNPWPAVFSRARKTVGEVWDRTRDVLSSSVEGELAEGDRGAVVPDHEEARTLALLGGGAGDEGDEVSARLGLSHQVILSWAWRAIKEAAALLATLFTLPLATKDQVFWTASEVDSAGKLFLALLTEIRHPGAFLAIYPAYVSLVASLVPVRPTSGVPSLSIPVDLAKLPARWLDRSLEALNVQHHTAGRRSAGLPFAVLSVLQGDPSLAAGAFDRLLAFSSGEGQSAEVRVTGMNTLQVVLSDARFAHLFPRFFEQAVILSLDALTSTDWAVRNAGLLLMGSLLRKAFTQKTQQAGDRAATTNASTGALFGRPPYGAWFGRHPRLLPLFLERLESFDPAKDDLSTAGGSIFAVLQALSNLQASDTSGDTMVDASQQAFERALRLLASSRQLDIREAAAYSLPAVVPRARLHATLCEILSGSLSARQNERHGRLLQLEVLLRQVGIYDDQAAVRNFSRELAAASGALLEANRCAPTAALYLDVVRALVEGSAATEVDALSAVHAWCERYLRKLKCSKDSSITGATREPGADRLDLAAARLVLARLRQPEGREPSIVANLTGHFLRSSMEEVCEVALLQVLDASDNDVLRSQTVVSDSIAALAFDRSASQRVRQAALACLGASSFSSSSCIPAGLTWEALVEDYATSTVQPFKELVLPLLGALIVAKKGDFSSIEGRVELWLAILEETSDEAQSNDFRSASILSLSLAPRDLLFPSPSSFSSSTSSHRLPYALRLRTQALVLRLLQDDSSHIRASAAQLAGSVVALRVHGGGGMAGAAARAAWWRFMEADAGGSGGEEQSWIAWLVARLIDDGEDKAEEQQQTAANKGAVLFEKERPNFFIEPELDIVSASLALGRAVQGQPGLLLSLPPQKQRVEEEEEEERGFAFFVEERKEHLRALRRKGLREAVLATA